MLRNLLEDYGWLPISISFALIAYKYLGFSLPLSAGVLLSSMFLSISLIRFRRRKHDPRRFIFGLVAGISIFFLVVAVHFNYLEMKQYLIVVALIPAFIIDYFLSKKYADLYD